MEPDIIGAQEELALAIMFQELMFRRCNRITGKMADFPVNSPERRALQDEYQPVLFFANQAQLAKVKAERKMLELWATLEPAPVFEALTRLDLPSTLEPIVTLIGENVVELDRTTVTDWIVDELARIKTGLEARNDPQR